MAKTSRKSNQGAAGPPAEQSVGGVAPAATIDRERVAVRAYELYLERGCGEGQDLEDWLCAERELYGEESRQVGASAAASDQDRRNQER